MYLAVQMCASCTIISMFLGINSDFFSQELTFILPVSLLIFSRSHIHHDWFYCHFIGQKTPPRHFLMVADSFIIFTPNPKRDGVSHTDF